MKRIITLLLFTILAFGAEAQRIKLLQLERYLGDTIPFRKGFVGLTNIYGDQEYKRLDSLIARVADSLIAEIPSDDTDEQYFDTSVIINDTLILSIIRDGEPAHRIPLTGLSGDHDWYEVGTTTPPDSIGDEMYNLGKVTIGDNASYDQDFAVPLSDIRVQEILMGYGGGSLSTNLRIGKNNLTSNTTGSNIVSIGTQSLYNNTTGYDLVSIGANSLKSNTIGSFILSIGTSSLEKNVNGSNIVSLGAYSMANAIAPYANTSIGDASMLGCINCQWNTSIGTQSLANALSNYNTSVGGSSLFNLTNGDKNVGIGYEAGYNYEGSRSIFIGYRSGRNEASNDKLFIENSSSSLPLIWGDFAGDSVRINGSLMVRNLTGVMDSIAGWRASDHKIGKIGLGTGFSITSGVLNYAPLIDQFEIIDDTLYISETGDGVDPFFVDLKSYIDTATAGYDTDSQSISQFYVSMDSLIISISRGNRKAAYLGDLTSIVETDNQRFDTAILDGCNLILSLQRDSVPAHVIDLCSLLDDTDDQYFDTSVIINDTLILSIVRDGLPAHRFDLKPYLTAIAHTGTTSYTGTLSNGGGAFTLLGGIGISLTHNGSGSTTIANTGMMNWFLDGLDDAFSPTEILSNNLASFQGAGGITAYLAADGSSTMVIDATGVDTDTDDQNLTLSTLSATQYGLNITDGTGTTFTKGPGILLTRTTNDLKIEAVDTSVTNEIPTLTHSGTGELLSTFSLGIGSINIKAGSGITAVRSGSGADGIVTISSALAAGDHDWYESGTTIPPDNIGDTMYHTGYTGIGIDHPIWRLDVSTDSRIAGHHIGVGTGLQTTTNLRVGKDALKGSITGIENIAIGSDAVFTHTTPNLILAIGTSAGKMLNGAASDNTIIGHYAMQNSTVASTNTAVGHAVLFANLRGTGNAIVGDFAAISDTSMWENVGLGKFVFNSGGPVSTGNIGLGYSAMYDMNDSASYNIAIGYEAIGNTVVGRSNQQYNIVMGYQSAASLAGTSYKNILVGRQTGYGLTGNQNIGIGDSVLWSTTGNNNIAIGNKNTAGSVSDNVIIGYNQHLTTSGNVVLTNGLGSAAGLRMLTTGFWGVNEAAPTQRWHVNGNMRLTGAYYDSNNDPGTSGQMLSSTVTGTDWVTATGMASFNINGIDDAFAPTAITNGGTIAFQGTNGITAKLPVLGSGTIVIDAAGVTGTSNLAFVPSSGTVPLTSSSGTDVTFTAGTGITLSTGGGSTNMTITASEVDGSVTNEGSLTLLSGPIRIRSNTTGSTDITLNGGTDIVMSAAGNTLSMGVNTAAFPDQSISNEQDNLTFSGSGPVTLNIDNSQAGTGGTDVTFTAGTGISFSAVSGTNITINSTGGTGTVTSVAMSTPTGITVSGSPITTSGTFTLTLNNDLQALEAFTSETGMIARTASNTYAFRTMTAGTGISITNGNGVSGNPTINNTGVTSVSLNSVSSELGVTGGTVTTTGGWTLQVSGDLQAIQNFTTETGIAVRTATNTWAMRTLTQPAAGLTISNNTGVSGNPTFALANDLAALEAISGTANVIPYRTGADTWSASGFTGLPTGFTSGWILWTDGSGTPEGNGSLTFNSGTSTLSTSAINAAGRVDANILDAGSYVETGDLWILALPTFANEAAAAGSGLSTGRVYKTAGGELRIKL